MCFYNGKESVRECEKCYELTAQVLNRFPVPIEVYRLIVDLDLIAVKDCEKEFGLHFYPHCVDNVAAPYIMYQNYIKENLFFNCFRFLKPRKPYVTPIVCVSVQLLLNI